VKTDQTMELQHGYTGSDVALRNVLAYIERHPRDVKAYDDAVTLMYEHVKAGEGAYHEYNRSFREAMIGAMRRMADGTVSEIESLNRTYRKSLLMDAKVDFDAYCLYIEADREPEKQFYLPRRRVLHPIVKDLMALDKGELNLLSISLPPGTGKTTLAIFYLTWLGGKNPDSPMLTFSHDAGIVRGMYDEILRIVNPEGEYLWHDVFMETQIVNTNAKDLRIDLGRRKRFETFQFSSIGAGNAGKLRAAQLLFCDDLVESIEQAMSKERLDKLWTQYNTDIQQRKTGECKELHIATRWSVHDVIGRLERQEMDYPTGKAKFIVIPALNDRDESNFDYPGIHDKFTTAFYHKQRENMDDVNWKALYMNQPIEREGQLYNADELRRFFEMPEGQPDAVIAICDTKNKGSDYAFMPVAKIYGNDWYIVDCICDNGNPDVVEERLAQILAKYKVQIAEFESNSAGWHIAEKIQTKAKALGGIVKVTTRYTTANKETKIIVNAPAVKEHCLFLDNSKFRPNSDYGRMMLMLTSYTMAGRNKHDDVPDGMAMLALYMERMKQSTVEVLHRPW